MPLSSVDSHEIRIIAVEHRLLSARMCWKGFDRIAERAAEINASTHRVALGSIQNTLRDMAIIQVSALYDDSKSNKTHSLPHLLSFLRALPKSNDPHHFWERFGQFFDVKSGIHVAAFINFAERYKAAPLSEALSGVRARRDQHLAHYDTNPRAVALTYSHVDELLDHCKITLRMAATCYSSRLAKPDEELITHLSLHERRDLRRLLNKLIED